MLKVLTYESTSLEPFTKQALLKIKVVLQNYQKTTR